MLMTKYYTHVFEPAEFGLLALYVSMSQYLQTFMAFSFDVAAQRAYFEFPGDQRPRFLGTMFLFLGASCAATSLLLCAFMGPINAKLGGDSSLYLFSLAAAAIYIFYSFISRIAYNEKLSGLAARQTLLQSGLNHGISVAWVTWVSRAVAVRQASVAIAFAANSIAFCLKLKTLSLLKIEWAFDKEAFRKTFIFAFPSFATLILGTSFSYIDRFLLNHFHGKANVGIYSLGYTIGMGLSLVTEAMSMSLFPSIMTELKSDYEGGIRKLKRIDALFCSGIAVICLACIALRHALVALFSNHAYAKAADVLPFIVCGYAVGGGYKVVSSILSFHGRVWYMPFVSIIAFGFGGLMNWLLIPRFNEIGAAYATFLGLFAYSYIQHLFGSKYYVGMGPISAIYAAILASVTFLFAHMTGLL